MASNNLPEGFEDVPLQDHETLPEGFHPVDLKQSTLDKIVSKGGHMLNSAVNDAEDLGRGVLEGATLGGSGEILGGINALGGLATGQVKDKDDLIAKYKQFRDLQNKSQEESKARSPILYRAGEVGGTIAGAGLTGGADLEAGIAAKLGSQGIKSAISEGGGKLLSGAALKELATQGAASAAAAIPYGAAAGTLGSKGELLDSTPEQKKQVLHDAESGAMSGGVVGGLLGGGLALGKAGSELAGNYANKLADTFRNDKNSPFYRQLVKAYEMGKKHINPNDQTTFMGSADSPESVNTALATQPTKTASDLVDQYFKGDKLLSDKVGEAVEGFVDEAGAPKALDLDEATQSKAKDLLDYAQKDPSIGLNDNFRRVLDQFKNLDAVKPTAQAVMSTRSDLYNLARMYQAKDPNVAGIANDIAASLGNELKTQVPGYAEAAAKLKNYRSLLGEGTLAGDTPIDFYNNKISRTKDSEAKLLNKFRDMIDTVSYPGEAGRQGQESFTNLLGNTQKLNASDPETLNSVGMNPSDLQSKIQNASDDATTVSLIRGHDPRSSASSTTGVAKSLLGGTGLRGKALSVTRKAGSATEDLASFGRNLTKATDETLMNISNKLPGPLRNSLQTSIKNKDVAGKNAALFSIMQNPEYRKLVQPEDLNQDEK